MNAKQIIARYDAGERDFRRRNLRGMNFKGADLSGADFSECDICGTNFRGATLQKANFTKIKGGLQKRWYFSLLITSIVVGAMAGLLKLSAGSFFNLLVDLDSRNGNLTEGLIIEFIATISYLVLLLTAWRKGIVASLSAVAFAVAFAVIFSVVEAVAEGGLIAIAIAVAGSALVAIAVVISGAISGAIAVAGVIAGIIAGIGVIVGIIIAGVRLIVVTETIAGAGVITVIGAIFWTWISWRAWRGDPRDAWVRSFAVAYGAIGGTCFRGADLTDADFTAARLKSTDFREAKLVRTIFKDTIKLDQVRPGKSYLGIKKIRELLLSGKANSEDKNYNRLINLQGLNLAGFDLTSANFSGSDLSNSNLSGANLTDANLITANLNDADLKDANLSRAKLVQTQLDNTDLTGANLTGACIEDWGITVYTVLNGIHCDYVYMRFIDGDKRRRKPDGEDVNFAEGEFVEFIKPLVDTLDLYHRQVKDPRTVSLALKQLQAEHPEAEIEPISWERRGKNGEDIMIRSRISEKANPSQLHAAHFEEYDRLQALPPSEIQTLMARIDGLEKHNSMLAGFVDKALSQPKIHAENWQGDAMSNKEDRSISIGGDAGIVGGGDVKDVNFQGTMNLGEISGNVINTINQLPDSPDPDKPNIKELLSQLQAAINAENELSTDDKADALEQIRTFAEAAQNPSDSGNQKLAKTASRILKGILAEMPTFTAAAKQIKEYLPLILTFFGL